METQPTAQTQIEKVETLPPSPAYIQKAEQEALAMFNPKIWSQMNIVAGVFMQSGALPATIKNAPQLMMVLQAGVEVGLKPIEAMNSFYFVNGKLAMYGEKALALVRRAGHKISWGECNAETATITITRGDSGESMTSTITAKMVKDRGIDKNPVFGKYPENFLKFKAFHMTAKFIVPDALSGQTVGEAVDDSMVVEVVHHAEVTEPKDKPEEPKTASVTTGLAVAHKTLDAALEEKPEDEEVPESKKKRRVVKDVQAQAKEEGVKEPDVHIGVDLAKEGTENQTVETAVESDEAKYARLIEQENEGKIPLTSGDKMWMGRYNAMNKQQA